MLVLIDLPFIANVYQNKSTARWTCKILQSIRMQLDVLLPCNCALQVCWRVVICTVTYQSCAISLGRAKHSSVVPLSPEGAGLWYIMYDVWYTWCIQTNSNLQLKQVFHLALYAMTNILRPDSNMLNSISFVTLYLRLESACEMLCSLAMVYTQTAHTFMYNKAQVTDQCACDNKWSCIGKNLRNYRTNTASESLVHC